MKRIISVVLAVSVLLSFAVPISAESKSIEQALAGVKTRIAVPEDYTVFRSSMTEYGKESYYFNWSNEEGNGNLSVHTDEKGRINSYYLSKDIKTSAYPSLPDISREKAESLATEFLKRSAFELVSNDTDKLSLVSTTASQSGGITYYSFIYSRKHNGYEVLNNNAHINVTAYSDIAYVSDASIEWDYNTEFSDDSEKLDAPEKAYFDVFPIELRYERTYENIIKKLSDGTEIIDDVVLLYGFKDGAGYISAVDGKKLEPEFDDKYRLTAGSGGATNESMKEMAADTAFSEAELAEIERVEGLMSKEEAEKLLRGIPSLALTDKMTVRSIRIYRQRPWYITDKSNVDDEKFMLNIALRDDETGESANMTVDAECGEIKNIYRYGGAEKGIADSKSTMDLFIKAVAPTKTAECEEAVLTEDEYSINVNMRRMVNGVPYNNNGISYNYSKEYSRISNYNLEWDEYADFTNPKSAIEKDIAEKKVLEHSPLKAVYIPNGGKYRLCYTISKPERQSSIDALTGETVYENYNEQNVNINYSDINGHWAELAVRALADAGIGEATAKFCPNNKMTQKDLLMYLASAFLGRYYWEYDENSFYDMLERRGYINDGEINPSAYVTREDSFKFMVRFMGFERVAKLGGIYKVNYNDASELSEDKVGYAAILTGFGVVSGDGSSLRPKSEITKAECAMMVYKYFSYKGE